jgi:hypothetical protein
MGRQLRAVDKRGQVSYFVLRKVLWRLTRHSNTRLVLSAVLIRQEIELRL